MSGHMGAETVTQRGLRVLDADLANDVLIVIGAIPGPTGGIVYVREDI
jgi:large subunit ribosomal protein L3